MESTSTAGPIMVPLEEVAQATVVIISSLMGILFLVEFCKNRAGWEAIFVCFAEAFGYIAALFSSKAPTVGPNNEPLLRYVSWIITCPILIKVLYEMLTGDKNVSAAHINQLVLADLMMNMCGIFGVMYDDDSVMVTFFVAGCVFGTFIVYRLYHAWKAHVGELPFGQERLVYFIFFLVSWTIFPILYLLGPGAYGLVTHEVNVILHAVGDLLGKNCFAFFAWLLNRKTTEYCKRTPGQEYELAVVSTKPAASPWTISTSETQPRLSVENLPIAFYHPDQGTCSAPPSQNTFEKPLAGRQLAHPSSSSMSSRRISQSGHATPSSDPLPARRMSVSLVPRPRNFPEDPNGNFNVFESGLAHGHFQFDPPDMPGGSLPPTKKKKKRPSKKKSKGNNKISRVHSSAH